MPRLPLSIQHDPPVESAGADRGGRSSTLAPTPPLVAALLTLAIVGGGFWEPLAPAAAWLGQVANTILIVLGICAVHEAGHLVGGLSADMPFSRFSLGIVTFGCEDRPDGVQLSVGWNRDWLKVAGCVEREIAPGPRLREALTATALGGPVASIVAGALLWACPAPWRELGTVSLLIGLVNAVPMSWLGQQSDGMIVWRLWSSDPADVAWRAPFLEPVAGGPLPTVSSLAATAATEAR
jgi:hypothetical protein